MKENNFSKRKKALRISIKDEWILFQILYRPNAYNIWGRIESSRRQEFKVIKNLSFFCQLSATETITNNLFKHTSVYP